MQNFRVSISESPLFLIQNGFNVLCDPGLVVWVTFHCPAVLTEVDVVSAHVTLQMQHTWRQSHNVQSFQHFRANLIDLWFLATGELYLNLSDHCQGYKEVFPQVFRLPRLASSQEDMLVRLRTTSPAWVGSWPPRLYTDNLNPASLIEAVS